MIRSFIQKLTFINTQNSNSETTSTLNNDKQLSLNSIDTIHCPDDKGLNPGKNVLITRPASDDFEEVHVRTLSYAEVAAISTNDGNLNSIEKNEKSQKNQRNIAFTLNTRPIDLKSNSKNLSSTKKKNSKQISNKSPLLTEEVPHSTLSDLTSSTSSLDYDDFTNNKFKRAKARETSLALKQTSRQKAKSTVN